MRSIAELQPAGYKERPRTPAPRQLQTPAAGVDAPGTSSRNPVTQDMPEWRPKASKLKRLIRIRDLYSDEEDQIPELE